MNDTAKNKGASAKTKNAIINGMEDTGSAQNTRRMITWLSALIFLVLPTVLATLYFGLIAADQFATEVRFSIRGAEKGGSTDLLGMVTGLPSTSSTTTDSYIIMQFIHSRELLDILQKRIDLRKIYSSDKADWISRFDPNETIEEFAEYWKRMASVQFDSSTNIVAVEIRAFTAEEAKLVANGVLKASEELVNGLSVRLRKDAVRFAEIEVKRAEERLLAVRIQVRKFRDIRDLDPVKKAESNLTILASLNKELVEKKTQLSNMLLYLNKSSPTIRVLENEINSLEKQIQIEKKGPGQLLDTNGNPLKLSMLLADYEELIVNREFAEKAYVSALSSLELARAEADRQQRYLAAFIRPSLPEEAIYPERIIDIILVFVISLILWSLGLLVVYGIRDHG